MTIALNNLRVGSLYRFFATDTRSWVPWFEQTNAQNSSYPPLDDSVIMYLGTIPEHPRSLPAHMFLWGEKKYYVYNTSFIYSLELL